MKSLVLKMAEKKAKIPRLVLDLEKILPKVSSLNSSSPDDPSKTCHPTSTSGITIFRLFTLNGSIPSYSSWNKTDLKFWDCLEIAAETQRHLFKRLLLVACHCSLTTTATQGESLKHDVISI